MGNTKYKIAYFHQDGLITGSAISLRNLIQALDKELFEPIVVLAKEGSARKIFEECNVPVIVFEYITFWTSPGPKCFGFENLFQYRALIASTRLKSFILNLAPDLIHINDKASIQVGITMKGCQIPIIQHTRSAFHNTRCKLNKFLSSYIIKLYANHIIAISEDEIQGFENFKALTIMYNTVNLLDSDRAIHQKRQLRDKLGIEENELVIGMAENMSIQKGLLDIISIIEFIRLTNCKNIKFLIVGKLSDDDILTSIGIEKSSLAYFKDFLEERKLNQNVILTGFQTEALNYIAIMDIIIVSKSHGVLGRQPIEAQSVGTTVLAINGHSQKSKIVEHGKGGFLVKNLNELKDTLLKLIKSPETLLIYSRHGHKYARERFNMNNYAKDLKGIYIKYLEK